MKQTILLVAFLAAVLASGCSRPQAGADGRKHILCSTFPMYLFTANIAKGASGVEVQLMIPAAMGCPHDYSLTPDDLRKIAAADVFVANGLGMEEFLGKPLAAANPKLLVIDSSVGVTDLLAFTPEEGGEEEAGHHHHSHFNPHLFASPDTAARVVQSLAGQLAKADPDNAKLYADNAGRYVGELLKVGREIRDAVHGPPAPRIVTEHAVFDYLARDAGLEIVAVVEESPGQAPSAAEMLRIVGRIKAAKAAALFTEPQYPAAVGETIAKETGIPAAMLDPVANGPADAPLDYYQQVMRQNARVLAAALGGARAKASQPATVEASHD